MAGQGLVRSGLERYGMDSFVNLTMAGEAGKGLARQGWAGLGKAGHGFFDEV